MAEKTYILAKHLGRVYMASPDCVYGVSMSIFRKKEKDELCPECEKQQKHVKLVKSEGQMICPECRYVLAAMRK